jgi:hypothetical protein
MILQPTPCLEILFFCSPLGHTFWQKITKSEKRPPISSPETLADKVIRPPLKSAIDALKPVTSDLGVANNFAPSIGTKKRNVMNYRQLGHSGLIVPELTFGTMLFGEGDYFGLKYTIDQSLATEMVAKVLDHGINFFDTAHGYSSGLSEKFLGKALAGRRHEALIATKIFYRASPFWIARANDGGRWLGLSFLARRNDRP